MDIDWRSNIFSSHIFNLNSTVIEQVNNLRGSEKYELRTYKSGQILVSKLLMVDSNTVDDDYQMQIA